MLGIDGRHSIVSRAGFDYLPIFRAELRDSCGDSAAATAHHVALTRRLPKQCQNNGIGGLRHATRGTHHCAVNVKGVPAKPQYPLRGSDGGDPLRGSSDGGGSLVSHRHIMQPDPWHRKKCPLIA
jgi:hypothetical protein